MHDIILQDQIVMLHAFYSILDMACLVLHAFCRSSSMDNLMLPNVGLLLLLVKDVTTSMPVAVKLLHSIGRNVLKC